MPAPVQPPRIIACVNLKGGVGKTTLAVNLAAYCGSMGYRTLLVDLDPQTNASFSCMELDQWEAHAKSHGTVADLLDARTHATADGNKKSAQEVIVKDVFDKVDLIPSHVDLFTVDLDLAAATARESKLKKALKPVLADYDIVICDCPPNLTIPTQNALAMSSHYVVPISPDYLSGIGVGLLIKRVKELSEDLDNNLTLSAIVVSRVGRPAQHREETMASLKQQFKDLVLPIVLNERVKVAEAAAKKTSVFEQPDREAIAEFTGVCKEILKRVGIP